MSILKQGKPAAATAETYVATDVTQGVIKCCNQSGNSEKVRIAIIPVGESLVDGDKHYIEYDTFVPGNGQLSEPFEIDAGDTISIRFTNGTASYTIGGYVGVN